MDAGMLRDKLNDIFKRTIDDGLVYDGMLDALNYYNLFFKAATQDKLYKLHNNNFCMFKYQYKEDPSILMVFSIPINPEENPGKHIAERVMEIIEIAEECFITLDYVHSREIKEEKFVYITLVKKIGEDLNV